MVRHDGCLWEVQFHIAKFPGLTEHMQGAWVTYLDHILEDNYEYTWTRPYMTTRNIHQCRLDLLVRDKSKRFIYILEMVVMQNNLVNERYSQKVTEYEPLWVNLRC